MFIVLEGLDGAGKTTQVNLLQQHFETLGKECRFLHFPRFTTPVYGDLIAAFLRGEFGEVKNVDPRLVALLFAGDRNDAADSIRVWLEEQYVVILDRYMYSNIAFQCAKIPDKTKRDALRDWIWEMEYKHFAIPRPDRTIFLDVPFTFTRRQLSKERQGKERAYLQGKQDIHEADFELQQRVRAVYLEQAALDSSFLVLDCSDERAGMKSAAAISKSIINELKRIK